MPRGRIHRYPRGQWQRPIVGRCPDCGRVLRDSNSLCPHYGFVRRKCPSCGEMRVPVMMYCEKRGFGKAPDTP